MSVPHPRGSFLSHQSSVVANPTSRTWRRPRRREIGNESAPIQLAHCRFPALAISSAKISIYFSSKNKVNGSNFIKQHSETVMVLNYRNADCTLKDKFLVPFIIIFGTLSFPVSFLDNIDDDSGRSELDHRSTAVFLYFQKNSSNESSNIPTPTDRHDRVAR